MTYPTCALAIISNDLRVPFHITEVELVEVLCRAEITAHPRANQYLPFRIRFEKLLTCDQRKINHHLCVGRRDGREEQHTDARNGISFHEDLSLIHI